MNNLIPLITGCVLLALGGSWYFLQKNRAKWIQKRQTNMIFLQVLIPIKESKEDKETDNERYSSGQDFKEVLGIMDHLYQSLFSLYNGSFNRHWRGQTFFSLEYAALGGEILFFIVCPRETSSLFEKQLTSFFPDAVIDEVEDYNIFTPDSYVAASTIVPSKSFESTFRTYQEMKSDPLSTITNAFSKLSKDEGAAVQFVLTPAVPGWQKKVQAAASNILNQKKKGFSPFNPISWLSAIYNLFSSTNNSGPTPSSDRLGQAQEELSKALDEKASNPGYNCCIRLLGSAGSLPKAQNVLSGIQAAFSQFDTVNSNSFTSGKFQRQEQIIKRFIQRHPLHTWLTRKRSHTMLVGTSELTSFFHFPNIKYNKVDMIKWQKFKVAPRPKNIPESGLYLGINAYRGEKNKIFMNNEDRFRHFYIIGQTGTGKSSIIQLMARQDFHNGKGICVVDPHGSLIEDLLPYIPRERADDIIYFNPADTERPMGLNLLEADSPEERDLVALDAMNMMVKMFGEEIFGPRIQDYFRNGCLTLMEDEEEGGAITDLVKLFTDNDYQKHKVSKVKNPIVRSFWEKQMAQTGDREKKEMIPYFAAKFGQFYTNTLIRNIVGQTKSAFDVAKCMNESKILLMNLSKGLVGDINSKLLGMIIVQKIQVAAMRRQRLSSSERKDFFLYIDEFQNFVTPSIESILSEARKYRLGLVLAHQYMDQLESDSKLSGSTNLKGAVFGNVGTMMMYKIGPQDAEQCSKEMAPVFSDQDLVNLEAFKGAMKLSIDGQPSRPFSLDVPKPWLDTSYTEDKQAAEAYKQLSRLTYGRQRDFVDREILRRIG